MDDSLKCIVCGCDKNSIVYYFNDIPKFKQIGKPRNIVRCDNCSLVFCYPRNLDESMVDVYENDYWQEYQTTVGEVEIDKRVREFELISKERMGFIKKYTGMTRGKFLDVGCSWGFLVNEAKKEGFDSYGIDLNENDMVEGRSRYGINLKSEFLKNYDEDNFDVITSFNVIEHISDPLSMLEEKIKRLRDDGVIVIGTHDVDCEAHVAEKIHWKHIIPNEHLYFFSGETLERLASSVGLYMSHFHKPIVNGFTAYFRKRTNAL